jgi:hypothetical protein
MSGCPQCGRVWLWDTERGPYCPECELVGAETEEAEGGEE